MLKVKSLPISILILAALACRLGAEPQLFDHSAFTFIYPAQWHLMSALFPKYEAGRDYYRLGVWEIVTVTSAQKIGEGGVYFTVASAPLPETLDLETFQRQSYQPYLKELRDYSEKEVMIHDSLGYEITYARPWGEPWWRFRDLWLENDGKVYLLSFHVKTYATNQQALAPYQQEMDAILESFAFKSAQASPSP